MQDYSDQWCAMNESHVSIRRPHFYWVFLCFHSFSINTFNVFLPAVLDPQKSETFSSILPRNDQNSVHLLCITAECYFINNFELDLARILCIWPMLISIISSLAFFFVFVFCNLRNRGTTVRTRGPQEPQTPRPSWAAAVALQWWRAKVATPEMVSTHSIDDTCPFETSVNIRLGVFVCSRSVRPSVYTQYVYQHLLYCTRRACGSYICTALFKEHSLCLSSLLPLHTQ